MLGHHLGRIGHLRQPLGGNEGGRLDVPEAGIAEAADQLGLGRGRNRPAFVLEAVARAGFDDSDFARECHGDCAGLCSTADSTGSPSPKVIDVAIDCCTAAQQIVSDVQ
jgi:hypothetical protein